MTDAEPDPLDQLVEDLIPLAAQFAFAVHMQDARAVTDTYRQVPPTHRGAFCVALAAMVDIDRDTHTMLAWLQDGPPPISATRAAENRRILEEAIG